MNIQPIANFIGREAEFRILEAEHGTSRGAFVPIYGRRRVGKSELILRFLSKHRGIYFLGKRAPAAMQIREFLTEAATVLGEPVLASVATENWKTAIESVVSLWRSPEKLILCFDEYQWMVEQSPDLPSILQELWDTRWKNSNKVMLILCGSYIGFMEREVLGNKSPLFGRRTTQIHLKPFNHRDSALFHPNYSRIDQARTYFICGGLPLYLSGFSSKRSVESNIIDTILTEFAPLRYEPDFLLREELREIPIYYSILVAMAQGAVTAADIARETGIRDRALQYYFKTLIELGYITRRYPLTGESPVARHVRFELDDPLLRFWFRFVYPNTSFLAQMGPTRTFADRIRPTFDAYCGHAFERMCREALPFIYQREGISSAFDIGQYWSKDVQIDVVGLRQDGVTDIGECKWGKVSSAPALVSELLTKIGRYPNHRGATIGRRIFVRERPEIDSSNIIWHDLEDLYAESHSK
ncbi:MAG TPA: ATP-binding protein [Polyangium sp.]|nr:ATP-binding protein [Polyangium sp.]